VEEEEEKEEEDVEEEEEKEEEDENEGDKEEESICDGESGWRLERPARMGSEGTLLTEAC
jgi:hypothetical protein